MEKRSQNKGRCSKQSSTIPWPTSIILRSPYPSLLMEWWHRGRFRWWWLNSTVMVRLGNLPLHTLHKKPEQEQSWGMIDVTFHRLVAHPTSQGRSIPILRTMSRMCRGYRVLIDDHDKNEDCAGGRRPTEHTRVVGRYLLAGDGVS